MAERIKGITVEIGGDTVGLQGALRDVNKTSKNLQGELKDVQRLLKFDPNNVDLLAQRQQLLNEEIENSSKKLNRLKEAEAQVQQQFEKGEIGAEQYRAFQRELAETEQSLSRTQTSLADMAAEQDNVKSSMKQLSNLFEVTGKTVDDYSDILGEKLVKSIKNGTATSKDLEKAFDKVGAEATGSMGDIKDLRESIEKIDKGEKSIKEVRTELQKLEEDADKAATSAKDLGGELTGLIAGAAAGLGLAGAIEKGMGISAANTVIDITFDVPPESIVAVKNAVSQVETYGVEGEAALEGVRRQWQLNAEASDESNAAVVKGASAIVAAYSEIDFVELIQETNEIAQGFGISQEEALGLTKSLLDIGFPADQLDIIAEYGQQLIAAGFSAEEVQAVMAAGVDVGSWNIDVLLDGLKESRIVIAEFGTGVDDATKKMIEGTGVSAEKLQEWGKAVAEGGETGRLAMIEAAKAVDGIGDASKKNEMGVKLFGTLWEENGDKLTETLISANEKTFALDDGLKNLNGTSAALDTSPQVRLNTALSNLTTSLTPLLITVAEFSAKIADWVAKNPELTATILTIVGVLGGLIALFMVAMPIVTTLSGIMTIFGLATLAISTPILIAIGVILALIAVGILIWKNWDTIKTKAGELASAISKKFGEFKEAISKRMSESWGKIKEIWSKVTGFFNGINLKQVGKDIMSGLLNGIGSMASDIWRKAKEIATGIGKSIKKALKIGSPSKLTMELGEFTGEGLSEGLSNSMSKIKSMSKKMANAAVPDIDMGNTTAASQGTSAGKSLTVNLHSPKALDLREANRQFGRTLNKMSLMW